MGETKSGSDGTARAIIALAWPALVVLAATPLYLLLDTAIVGRLGAVNLAALAAGATVLSTVTTQLTFLSYGTTARAARHYGAKRMADAVYEGVQATWIALAVGSCLAIGVFTLAPAIMRALAPQEDVAILATGWMKVATLAIIPALVIMAGNGWLRGVSNTKWPLYFTLAGIIPMAVTVPVAVNRWGLVGSAIANVGGELIIMIGFVVALARYWRRWGDGRSLRPNLKVIIKQLSLGRDLIIRSLSFQVAFLSAAAVAGRFGPATLAAHQILLQMWNFLTLALDSVAISAQALVGAALGAHKAAKAKSIGRGVIRFSLSASLILAAVFLLGTQLIPTIFTNDAAVLDALHSAWPLLIALIILGGVLFGLDGVLLGAADVRFLRNITVVSAVVGFIPLVWASWFYGWGLIGIWVGLVSMILIRLIAVIWRYRSGEWAHTGS